MPALDWSKCWVPGCVTPAGRWGAFCYPHRKAFTPEENDHIRMTCEAPLWPAGTVFKVSEPRAGENDGILAAYFEQVTVVQHIAAAVGARWIKTEAQRRAKAPRSWMHRR